MCTAAAQGELKHVTFSSNVWLADSGHVLCTATWLYDKIGPSYFAQYTVRGNWNQTAISDLLRAGRSEDRIPVEAKFSAPVQTGRGVHPASYTMGTGSLSRGVKRQGSSVDHTPPSRADVKGRVELYMCSPSGTSWPVLEWTLLLLYLRKFLIRRVKTVSFQNN